MTEFTTGEVAALKMIVEWATSQCQNNGVGEDVIGLFLATGAAQCLEGDSSSVIGLIGKLEKKEVVKD